jgi:hypothetical protein
VPTKTGTIKVIDDGVTKTLMVKNDPDKAFALPEDSRFWKSIDGNAGQPITVTYTEGVPDTVTGVAVG